MRNEWIRGYGQQYRHLVIRREITKHYKKTHFACGKNTDLTLDNLLGHDSPKCPQCLAYQRETQ